MTTVSRGVMSKKPAARASAPKKAAPRPETAEDFDDIMDAALNTIPEEPELVPGEYRFRVRGVTKNPDKNNPGKWRVVMALTAIEAVNGTEIDGDLATYRPVFQSFSTVRAGDMRQLTELAAAAGIDTTMSRSAMIEKKAFTGVELLGSVSWSESEDGDRTFVNVRGLRVPE